MILRSQSFGAEEYNCEITLQKATKKAKICRLKIT